MKKIRENNKVKYSIPVSCPSYDPNNSSLIVSSNQSAANNIDFVIEDLNEMFQNESWDYDLASSKNRTPQPQEEPTTTVESISLSSTTETNSISMPASNQTFDTNDRMTFNSPSSMMMINNNQSSSMMISSSLVLTVNQNSFLNTKNSVSQQECVTNNQNVSFNSLSGLVNTLDKSTTTTSILDNPASMTGDKRIMDDKLRNLLTGGNPNLDETENFANNLSHTNPRQQKNQFKQSNSGDNILRELLDTDDDDMIGGSDINNTTLNQSSINETSSVNDYVNQTSIINSGETSVSSGGSASTTMIGSALSFVDLLSGTDSKVRLPSSSNSQTSTSNNMLRMLLNDDDCLKSSNVNRNKLTTINVVNAKTNNNLNLNNGSNDQLVDQLLKEEPVDHENMIGISFLI